MPHDVFISYSSKDRDTAEQLVHLITSSGISVWIDKSGIDVATSWSSEIVDAIDNCKAMVVLLSRNSIASVNVVKEVSLAAEQKKKILPLDIEPVELPRELRYHLAGIQRAPLTNIDAVIRALGKLGITVVNEPATVPVKDTESRKRLMILPFEDLSPTADNGWFADGIVSELISALSNIRSLRMIDAATTKEFKTYKGHLTTFAKEMSIRYFVQGDVRKFGNNIKITARLLDIDTGDYLWQDSIKTTMEDIFDVQETVANKVVEGLKLHLTSEEKQQLVTRETNNIEAYELYLQAKEYLSRSTKIGYQHCARLALEAIRLDPSFINAYILRATALSGLYRSYERDPNLLKEAESLCNEVLQKYPHTYKMYGSLSSIYLLQGKLQEAKETAKKYVEKAPQEYESHYALAFVYSFTNEYKSAYESYEKAVRIEPEKRAALVNLVLNADNAGELEKCHYWAQRALLVIERHLRLHPDDDHAKIQYAIMLNYVGRLDDARSIAETLTHVNDGSVLYNIAALYVELGDLANAFTVFRNALAAGYRNMPSIRVFMTNEEGIRKQFAGTDEFRNLEGMVAEIEREVAQMHND
jgi:adenylate cyclase